MRQTQCVNQTNAGVTKCNGFFLILSISQITWLFLQIADVDQWTVQSRYVSWYCITLHIFHNILPKTKSIIDCESCLINYYIVTEDCQLKTIMWNQYFCCERLFNLSENLLPSKGSGGSHIANLQFIPS